MIGLSESSYYYRSKSRTKCQPDSEIQARIESIHARYPTYGYRRIRAQLLRDGLRVNTKRIRRIMRENELFPVVIRSFRTGTTDSRHRFQIRPNLLREKKVVGLNEVWVADMTLIRLRKEPVYLAAILDLYSRKLLGWALSKSMNREVCLEALLIALERRRPEPGCIHHSDRGSQYACGEYTRLLKAHGFEISMSRPGNPYDNAFMESFYRTLKCEEVHLRNYERLEDVLKTLPEFLEQVYNRERLHSSLDYRSPEEFEAWAQNLKSAERPVLQL
jgi:putative transposase